jgi:ectoine hydroxylase-related dioxygenase (phytanoyl-CoA dioxygenase family)
MSAEVDDLVRALTPTPTGRAPSLPWFPHTAPMTDVLAAIAEHGGAIVRDFLAPDLRARLDADIKARIAQSTPGSRETHPIYKIFHGPNTYRFCGMAQWSDAFVEVLLDERLKTYADHFLLPNCGGYWMNTSQMMVVGPGEKAQILHRDSSNWPHFPWPMPELTVSCMFAINDFTLENGATQVVPGSHRWESAERRATADEITQAVMPAGSVLMYSGNVIHAAGENRTRDQLRYGMHLSWVLGWLRPEECHYLAVSLERARELPPRAQAMLGYHSYSAPGRGGRLGLVDFEDAKHVMKA